jgi:hypothetical protein
MSATHVAMRSAVFCPVNDAVNRAMDKTLQYTMFWDVKRAVNDTVRSPLEPIVQREIRS